MEAALRESQEEVGIDPRHVRILGQLDQVTAASSFLVTAIRWGDPLPLRIRLEPQRDRCGLFRTGICPPETQLYDG